MQVVEPVESNFSEDDSRIKILNIFFFVLTRWAVMYLLKKVLRLLNPIVSEDDRIGNSRN
jgi:hypothetical protein